MSFSGGSGSKNSLCFVNVISCILEARACNQFWRWHRVAKSCVCGHRTIRYWNQEGNLEPWSLNVDFSMNPGYFSLEGMARLFSSRYTQLYLFICLFAYLFILCFCHICIYPECQFDIKKWPLHRKKKKKKKKIRKKKCIFTLYS